MAGVYPVIGYRNAIAAIDFLKSAFGFEEWLVVPGDGGTVIHAELAHGEYAVLLHTRSDDDASSGISLYLAVDDVDAHFAHAKAAGATIAKEPFDTDYGSRDYRSVDPEGYVWNFGTYRPTGPATTGR